MLCAYYSPGIRTLETLISLGCKPEQIHLLSHNDERNQTLISFAQTNNISTKTSSIKQKETKQWIEKINPDIILSTYFRHIIPQEILNIPQYGGINIHPSLLPKYMGTFSIPWAIINGEKETGFTFHFMTAKIDVGNIILQKKIPIKNTDTAYSLYHKIIIESTKYLEKILTLVISKKYKGKQQVGKSQYFKREVPFGGHINPMWDINKIEHFIRAMYFPPFKGAMLNINGQEKEIFSIEEYRKTIS